MVLKSCAELSSFVRATLKPHIKSDRDLALAYCNFWMAEAVDGNGLRTVPWSAVLLSVIYVFVSVHACVAVDTIHGTNGRDQPA